MSKTAVKAAEVPAPQGPLIYSKIIEVMRRCSSITKDRKNESQGYNFRGIDDVYNELHPIMADVGVFTLTEVLDERTEERTRTKPGWQGKPDTVTTLIYRVLKVRFTFCAADGSVVEVITIGEGMDTGDKAANKAMAVAHKYALMQVFAIPTADAKDPENDSHEVDPKNATTIPPKKAAPIEAVKAAVDTPAPKPAAKKPGGYQGTKEQQEWLVMKLLNLGVETELFDEIGQAMIGKASKELLAVVKNVQAKHKPIIEPNDGSLKPEEIPFG